MTPATPPRSYRDRLPYRPGFPIPVATVPGQVVPCEKKDATR